MSLFDRHTPEGRNRFNQREFGDEQDFREMWNRGYITFMEVIQEANIGGEYLRYLYLNNNDGKYYQIVVGTIASDTPFRRL